MANLEQTGRITLAERVGEMLISALTAGGWDAGNTMRTSSRYIGSASRSPSRSDGASTMSIGIRAINAQSISSARTARVNSSDDPIVNRTEISG